MRLSAATDQAIEDLERVARESRAQNNVIKTRWEMIDLQEKMLVEVHGIYLSLLLADRNED